MPRQHATPTALTARPSSCARRAGAFIGLLAATLLTLPAAAQQNIEPDEIEAPEQPEQQEPQPIPGLEESDFRIRPAGITPEGTFLTRRAGRIVTLPSGERAFVFHPDEQGLALRPMVLMPSLTLQRMEQSMEDRDPGFLVTGEVFVFLGVNYLLPTEFSIASGGASTPPGVRPPPPPATPDQPKPDPAVEDLIRQLEQQRQRPRTAEPNRPAASAPDPSMESRPELAPGEPTLEPAAGSVGIVAEGQVLSRRRGRLIRLAAGEWAVAFDSGARQEVTLDRPLILMPCLNLQRLQSWAGVYGDSMPLQISGRITQYRGRNFLIPTLYRIAPVLTPLEPIQ